MPPKRKSVSGVQEAVKKLKPTAKRPRALATHSNGLSPSELNITTEKVTAEVSSKLDEKLEAFFEKFRQPTSNDKDKNDQGNTKMVKNAVQ
jgi:hypothetical protein